jgi:uncharacterized membrane protein YphA (DoxX/SURF4 family)
LRGLEGASNRALWTGPPDLSAGVPVPPARRLAVLASLVPALTGAALLLAASPASAHQGWFVHHPEDYPLDWSALLSASTLLGALTVVAVALLWRAGAARLPRPELPALRRLAPLAPYAPRLLALHLGASLLLLSLSGAVLDPAVHAGSGVVGTALLVPQVVVGSLLVLGIAVRAAATGVVLAGPVLVALEGPRSLLVCAVLVGIAAFLVLVPPSRRGGSRVALHPVALRPALLALRIGAAVSLVTLAVVEKLANPAMGVAMIEQQPVLNLLAPLGVSATTFVLVAGLVELLFGLLVLSGAAPQVVALVAAVPFTATLALFGTTELIGHLPVYGVLLTFVLLGSRSETSAALSWLPRPRTPERVG